MASKQDLGLFAGLVILGFCASQLVHKQLLAVRKACEISQTEISGNVPAQKTEDGTASFFYFGFELLTQVLLAIKLETLDELAGNANEEIRNAAIHIIVDRACKSQVPHLLLRNVGSKKREHRDKALTTVKYLWDWSNQSCFDPFKYTAVGCVIYCLRHQLPLSSKYEIGKAKGKLVQRTQPERDALQLLEQFLMKFGIPLALECNIFTLWLAKYPFGGDFEAEFPNNKPSQLAAKQRHVYKITFGKDWTDLPMARIMNLLLTNPQAVEKLYLHELLNRSGNMRNDDHEIEKDDDYSKIWYEVHGISSGPDIGLGPMMRRGVRARDDSWEEQTLRRRRREAMVLGEMGRPLDQENIIQRVNTL